MSGWLNKQRKSDLVVLADEAGLTRYVAFVPTPRRRFASHRHRILIARL